MSELLYDGQSTRSPQELFEWVRGIKSRDMRSNCVLTPAALKALCSESAAWISWGETAAVILCRDTENIVRLFYYAKNADALQEVRTLIPAMPQRIVCDIVGREPAAGAQVKELELAGFSYYAKFQRMICDKLEIDHTLDFDKVKPAVRSDAPEIYEMLHQEFDPLTARMPSMETLENRIADSEIFVVKKENKIAGLCIFSSNHKQAALLEYVIVRPEYRKERIAKTIMNYKWKYKNQSQYYILWVNSQCSGPVRFHEKNGFQVDRTYDYILLLNQ